MNFWSPKLEENELMLVEVTLVVVVRAAQGEYYSYLLTRPVNFTVRNTGVFIVISMQLRNRDASFYSQFYAVIGKHA